MSFKRLACLCIALSVPCAAHAQYQMISPMLYEGPRISLQAHADRNSSAEKAPAAPAVDPAALTYRPDLARRRANLARFVAKSRAADPAGADNLARIFASQDVIENMRAPLSAVGLRIDNVADAYAAWWVNAWQASQGVDYALTRRAALAVRDQAARAFAETGALRSANDAAKQEMAESLLTQATLIAAAMEQSKGNPERARQVAAAVMQGARGMHVDLASMKLTEDGFVPVIVRR